MASSSSHFVGAVLDWYAESARDLPWRSPEASPWAVMVSEVMLQQTPVARVEPAWRAWMCRWPSPGSLAADSVGDAVRMWGRLGYPRRAMRLHQAAALIVAQHGGQVPGDVSSLRALPGIGSYASAAIAAFAFDVRVAVLDTNVRRVYARHFAGVAGPRGSGPSVGERAEAAALVPEQRPGAFSVAVMELGALVCTARAPKCGGCPVASTCRWLSLGRPGLGEPLGAGQTYAGTDRQVRGRLLAVLRDAHDTVMADRLDVEWADAGQRQRALESLLLDGLVEGNAESGFHLPR